MRGNSNRYLLPYRIIRAGLCHIIGPRGDTVSPDELPDQQSMQPQHPEPGAIISIHRRLCSRISMMVLPQVPYISFYTDVLPRSS
jgi:hypothetical protein